jgi:hypothetical protein
METTLTPIAVYGGFWIDLPSIAKQPEIGLVSLVYTKQGIWVVDHCAGFFWESFQPFIPVWWFRYLMLTGKPPSLTLLQDPITPISVRLEQLTKEHEPQYTPIIGYPQDLQEFYREIHAEWIPVSQKWDYFIMRFKASRIFSGDLQCAPLQFRNYGDQQAEIYSTRHLQAAIGIALSLHTHVLGQPKRELLTGVQTAPEGVFCGMKCS